MAEATSTRIRAVFLFGSVAALFLWATAASLYASAQAGTPAPSPASRPFRQHPHRNPPADSHHINSLPPASNVTQAPAPIVRTPNTGFQVSANPVQPQGNGGPGAPRGAAIGKGEHLGDWMMAHSNLTLPEQQAALDREPGFHDLPQATQQRIHDRLAQLSTMSPEARQRMIRRTEMMEKLPPAQRAEVRSALLQLSALPPDQRKVVSRAFRELRGMPPEQRIPVLNSRYSNLTEQQRLTLGQLMHIEPLLPPDEHP